MRRRARRGRTLGIAASLSVLFGATPGAAQAVPEEAPVDAAVESCTTSFADAQHLRNESRLVEALVELEACARSICPPVIADPCTVWLQETERDVPTVVVQAVDRDGFALPLATVEIDGVPTPQAVSGLATPVDPGPHQFMVRLADGEEKTLEMAAVQGGKNQRVRFLFAHDEPGESPAPSTQPAPPPPPEGEAPFSLHPVGWAAFGVGAAGLVAGTVTGVIAFERESSLRGTDFTPDELDTAFRIADASTGTFVVGAVGLATGLATLLFQLTGADDARADTTTIRWTSPLGPASLGVSARF